MCVQLQGLSKSPKTHTDTQHFTENSYLKDDDFLTKFRVKYEFFSLQSYRLISVLLDADCFIFLMVYILYSDLNITFILLFGF